MSPSRVKNGYNESSGKRFLVEFAEDYKALMGTTLCLSCNFNSKFYEFINKLKTKKMSKKNKSTKLEFQIKPKYKGVQLGFGSNVMLTDSGLSEELALRFCIEHPRGKELFETLPENVDELIEDYPKIKEKADAEAKKKADADAKAKADAKKQKENLKKGKDKAKADAKKEAEDEAKKKSEEETKKQAEAAKKAEAEKKAAKKKSEDDDLLG